EGGGGGGPPPPDLAAVDDVVMKEGSRMDELEGHRRLDRIVTPELARTDGRRVKGEQDDRGTDALPARVDQVSADRVQAFLARGELGGEARLGAGAHVLV